MKDEHETREHLINELVEMRQRVAQLEAADTASASGRRKSWSTLSSWKRW